MSDWARILRSMAPHASPHIVAAIVDHIDQLDRYGLDSPRRAAHLFAHMFVETQGFTTLEENLNYSAERLHAVWPKRFPTVASAKPFAHNPKALALKVYGSRLGNDPKTDDGWVYRGKGPLQTTGKENVEKLAEKLKISLEEANSWLTDPEHCFETACANFVMNGAVPFADHDDIVGSTHAVNGGENGLDERIKALAAFKKAWAVLGNAKPIADEPAEDPIPSVEDVKFIQERLRSLNFPVGKADGLIGPGTRSALRDFQDQHGLRVTGEIDAPTRRELMSATAQKRAVSPERASATVDDLRKDGSRTILATDDTVAHLGKVLVNGAVATVSGGVATVNTALDQAQGAADKAKATADKAQKLAETSADLVAWIGAHQTLVVAALIAAVALAAVGFSAWRIFKAAQTVRAARLDDHRSWTNNGR